MNSIKSVLLSLVFIGMALGVSAQKKAEISVNINLQDAAGVELKPFTNFPCYTLAKADLDKAGKAVLSIDAKTPFMAALKVHAAGGRPLYTASLYLEPGSKLEATVTKKEGERNPEIAFRGKGSKENEALKKVLPTDFKLGVSSANSDATLRKLEEELNRQDCSSKFKNYVLKSVGLFVQLQKLPKLLNDTEAYRKALQELLSGLQQEDYWQSIPQWPNELDNFFAKCEAEKLIPTAENGLSYRLQCIGDENIRNRYALYALERLVNFRSWFENPPVKTIESLKPYMTTEEAKQKYASIVTQFERLEKSWSHLRNQPAPDFTFEDVNGKMVTLSDYRGKFVLLDVWNIYCGPCMDQVPYLQKLEPELEKMNVTVIGVSCDPQNIKDKWQNTVRNKKMPGTQVIMDKGRKSKFMTDYCIMGFPTFCLIGPDGMVINPFFCRPEKPEFMQLVKQKIKEYDTRKK